MGSITIVNLTDSSIQSAIANAGNIHSGINGVLPHAYYHHNALSGTGYDVWEKWYIPGIVDEFPSSDLSKIGWYIAGTFITAAGLFAAILSVGAATPLIAAAWGTFVGTVEGATAAYTAGAALGTFVATVAADAAGAAAIAAIGYGAIAGISGVGITIGAPVADYIASSKKRVVEGPVWGQDNRILSFTGKIPLEACQVKDCQGQTITLAKIPAGTTAKTALPPQYKEDLTPQAFDMMRRKGEIYQIKHRDGEYGDQTQGFVRMNLRGGGGQEKQVTHGGITVDISKIYKIFLLKSKDAMTPSCLRAGEDEDDNKVYLMQGNENQQLSCCYWQFIPTREKGLPRAGIPIRRGKAPIDLGGWIIVDRCNVRALCWSDGAIRQYPSEELGIIIKDGWAEHVTREGMVWDLSSFEVKEGSLQGSIAQPGTDRMCVTAHANDDSEIDVIPFNNQNALQTWVVKAVDDGSDFKDGVGLSGFVYLQDTGQVPLVNDQFAGTRDENRRLQGFQIEFNPPIPNLNLEYMAHLESFGDTKWVKGGESVRTTQRLEGFAIRLTGSEAEKYRVSYMAYIEGRGDTDFYHDGEFCGTRGQYRQVEGIQVHVERR